MGCGGPSRGPEDDEGSGGSQMRSSWESWDCPAPKVKAQGDLIEVSISERESKEMEPDLVVSAKGKSQWSPAEMQNMNPV